MNFPTALGKSILPVIGGYLLGGYVASLFFAAYLRMGDGTVLERWLHVPIDAFGISVFALLATVLPVFLLAWPIYALLLSKDRAQWVTVTVIPLVPALLIWALDGPIIGGLAALYGLCMVWIAHALRLRFVRVPELGV